MTRQYLHGYTTDEQERLIHQSRFLESFVYEHVDLSSVTKLLEVGSGVGAQTEILLERYPQIQITCIDISDEQINLAKKRLDRFVKSGQIEIIQADATDLSILKDDSFDGSFICWFLEHVPDPLAVLKQVKAKLKPGGVITATEVNNSSLFVDPYSPHTLKYWYEFNDLQWNIQGHPFVGLQLGNLYSEAGFKDIAVNFRPMQFDHRDPKQKEQFLDYFFNIFKSANDKLVSEGKVPQDMISKVKAEFDLAKTDQRGVFHYTFVQGTARA